MSSLLEKAIIDARALKEAALKSAENLVIEKYSQEVRETMDSLLNEQEDDMFSDPMASDPMAADPMAADPMAADPMAADPMAADPMAADPLAGGAELTPTDEGPELPENEKFIEDIPDAFEAGIDDGEVIKINLNQLEAEFDKIAMDREEAEIDSRVHPDGDGKLEIDIDDLESMAGTETPDFSGGEPIAPGGDLGTGGMEADLGVEPLAEDIDISSLFEEEGCSGEEEKKDEATDDGAPTEPAQKEVITSEADEMIEEIAKEVAEALKVDMDPQMSGWAGTPQRQLEEYESMLLARENDDEVKEKNKAIRDRVKELTSENKTLGSAALKLQNQNEKLNDTIKTLHEKLEQSNVANAKLLYINQTLENTSLNERQKRKIVEAISKADTVNEARMLFNTLQETVVKTTENTTRGPNSLTEAVASRSSLLLSANKQQKVDNSNPMYNRLQKLAGIKT